MPSQVKKGHESDEPEAQGAAEQGKNEKRNIADNRADEDTTVLI
jgi:hypothetical protein